MDRPENQSQRVVGRWNKKKEEKNAFIDEAEEETEEATKGVKWLSVGRKASSLCVQCALCMVLIEWG